MKSVIVTTDPDSGVTTIEFERPGKANALLPELAREIAHAIEVHGPSSRCIILQSIGRVFCSGVDLSYIRDFGAHDQVEATRTLVYESFQRVARAQKNCPVPVIVRLHGGAAGAGADLALAADIRIASESAWLQESWILIGATSALGGAHTIGAIAGAGRAMEIMLTGRRIHSAELMQLGLVERVVAPEDLDQEVREIALEIASKDPQAVRATKALIRGGPAGAAWDAALESALEYQVNLVCRPQFREQVDEMLSKLQKVSGRNQKAQPE